MFRSIGLRKSGRKLSLSVLVTALVLTVLPGTALAQEVDQQGPMTEDETSAAEPEEASHAAAAWPMAGQNLHNTRHQAAETRIGPANVSSLAPRWVFKTDGDVSATPTVEGDALYVPDWAGWLYKIDIRTGQEVWSRSISEYNGIKAAVSRTSPAIYGDSLIIGDQNGGHVMAVDKNSGNLIWITQVDSHIAAIITQSPVVYGDRVYVGVSSNEEQLANRDNYQCCTFRGSVVSLDARTGKVLWKTYTVPEGYSGGAVWSSTPVVDEKRGLLYITTGNNYTVPPDVAQCAKEADISAASDCMAPDNYMDSVIALDLDDGRIVWGTRVQGFDAYTHACHKVPPGVTWCPSPDGPDFDFGSGANLFTVMVDGAPRDVVGAGQKSGVYWALDPDTGQILWQTLVGPGGGLGGVQWGTATDGERIYVANSNSDGEPHTLFPSGETASAGTWTALDAATGEILWQTADPGNAMAQGPVTVANGVVYAGSMDPQGHMYALDAATGEVLWSFPSGGSVVSGPAIVDGVVYWGSGYARLAALGATGSSKLYAFALSEQADEASEAPEPRRSEVAGPR